MCDEYTITCKHCESQMVLKTFAITTTIIWHQYVCEDCGARAPAGASKQQARAAALRYAEPTNRILTLDEVLNTFEGLCWYEDDDGNSMPAYITTDFIHLSGGVNAKEEINRAKYGIETRFWLRCPTDTERAAAPWKEDKPDDI